MRSRSARFIAIASAALLIGCGETNPAGPASTAPADTATPAPVPGAASKPSANAKTAAPTSSPNMKTVD